MTFEDLQQIAENDTKVNPRKSDSWRVAWKALSGFFGGMRAVDIDHAKLNEYVSHRLALPRTRGTVKVELATLRRAFNLAAIDGKAIPPKFPTVEESAPRKGFFEVDAYMALLVRLPEDIAALTKILEGNGMAVV